MSAEQQTEMVANYIMANVPGEPSRNEGAGKCAVRLMDEYRAALAAITCELGVPSAGYPAPVANAYEIARCALEGTANAISLSKPRDGSSEIDDCDIIERMRWHIYNVAFRLFGKMISTKR